MIETALILCGGMATRLGALAATRPKSLIEVEGAPFVAHQLALLKRNGIRRVVLAVGHLAEAIEAEIGDGARYGVPVGYSHDGPVRLGTGGAVLKALPQLGAAFFVVYGDSYLTCDYRQVARHFASQPGVRGLMTVFRNEGMWGSSNIVFTAGRIAKYDKASRDPAMRHIDYGLNILTAAAFAGFAAEKEFDLSLVFQRLLAAESLAAFEVAERFYEIGSHEGLADLAAYLRKTGKAADRA
jgi:N-acetyl-alpha-D-muramate 1-phosphate uridylyltransferase